MPSANDEPQLELPLPLPARQTSLLAPALLLLGLIGGGVYATTDADTKPTTKIPSRPEDLSPNVVTLSPDDRAAVASAVAALKVAPPQRAEIEQAVIDRRQRRADR
jgi:hypothetical protein